MAAEDEGVTLGEMNRNLRELKVMVAENISDHEKRLRVVERWMWTALGASLVGAGSGLFALLGGGG